jgi:hypothetical protein
MRRLFVPDRYEATEWYEGALGMKVYSEDGARAVRLDLPPDGRLRVAGARAATPNLVTEVGGGPSSTNSSTVSGGAILLSVATAMLRGVHEQTCNCSLKKTTGTTEGLPPPE